MESYSNPYGSCGICGFEGKLSFEHVPPKSSFNNKPIFVQDHVSLTNQDSPLYQKKMRSNKGSGGYFLCEKCNNLTGDWYVKDFSSFTHQGVEILKSSDPKSRKVEGNYMIKPLNVLKQIFTMFLSIDRSGILRANHELIKFILNKDCQDLDEKFQVYIYSDPDLTTQYRRLGYMFVGGDGPIRKWSEINFPPFGYLLCDDSPPPNDKMLNITPFKKIPIDKEIPIILKINKLIVDSFIPGDYK